MWIHDNLSLPAVTAMRDDFNKAARGSSRAVQTFSFGSLEITVVRTSGVHTPPPPRRIQPPADPLWVTPAQTNVIAAKDISEAISAAAQTEDFRARFAKEEEKMGKSLSTAAQKNTGRPSSGLKVYI